MKLSSVFSAIVNPLGALSEAAAKTNIPDALMPAVERKIAGTDYTAENILSRDYPECRVLAKQFH